MTVTAVALVQALVIFALGRPAHAQGTSGTEPGEQANLAQELTNPLADLLTIPIQMSYDSGIGREDDGSKLQTNFQPVYPFQLTDDWNLISRTILPVTYQSDIVPGSGSQFGLGDINLSLFFSPRKPKGGVIWGVGPVFLLPTATDTLLGAEKWGAGPTAVVLAMRGRWTMGVLGNHIWSFGGEAQRTDISNTFIQPFVAYTWPNSWTFSVLSESTYNWKTEEWSVPVNVAIAKLVRLGRLPVSVQGGAGRWLQSPEAAAEGWRYRLQANIVLPKPR